MSKFVRTINGMTFNSLQSGHEVGDTIVGDHYNFKELINGGTVIDLGANIGTFSVRAAYEKGCTCYSYEASPTIYQTLVDNITINNLQSKIYAFNNAIWDVKIKKPFFFFPAHPMGSSLYVIPNGETITETANCITIADVFNDNNIGMCDFLKMDVEGAESCVFKEEYIEYLKRCRIISFEFHSDNLCAICELMCKHGFAVGDYRNIPYKGGPHTIRNLKHF